MGKLRNVLWIMADQLRWDYLSCYGHPHLETPHLDGLAAKGVRFNKAYVQSPICGPSRMSFYTGRYVRSHGATWNGFPLRVGEPTLGDHLREIGAECVLVGKTHMIPDTEGMARLGIDPESMIGVHTAECGFTPFERDDGMHPEGYYDINPNYDQYLRDQGLGGENPWEEWANSAQGDDGELLSGWLMENSNKPARVPEEHSETPYMTTRGIEFIEQAGDKPWLCHLSYIKPHWPYIVPPPYHDMYGADDVIPAVRSNAERMTDHPVYRAWQNHRVCKAFSRDEVRERVIPAYMGLIKQLDDQMGRLFAYLKETGRMEDTMIVMSSDHGDYLGDHWLGEKDLFHDASARIPLIIYDPREEADATRGTTSDALVEGIDLAPTFLELMGGEAKPHILEGRSLVPILEGRQTEWRKYAISEYDYATRQSRAELEIDQADARLLMIYDGRWKYILAEGFRPLLFDLENDPDEVVDLGAEPEHEAIRAELHEALFAWARQHHTRITRAPEQVNRMSAGGEPPGIQIGFWNEEELRESGRKSVHPPVNLDS
ncbi:MAG: phosphonate monoester hydrolase [Alphaproteobacteria bacterium]|nr:phosphonate monoester hydrolase [Alphaproteobacteria bacterium]